MIKPRNSYGQNTEALYAAMHTVVIRDVEVL